MDIEKTRSGADDTQKEADVSLDATKPLAAEQKASLIANSTPKNDWHPRVLVRYWHDACSVFPEAGTHEAEGTLLAVEDSTVWLRGASSYSTIGIKFDNKEDETAQVKEKILEILRFDTTGKPTDVLYENEEKE